MAKNLFFIFVFALVLGSLSSCNKHGCPALENVESNAKKKKVKAGKTKSGLFPKGFE